MPYCCPPVCAAATMGELNDNEKYHYLPCALPATPSDIGTIHSGDIMLYGSNTPGAVLQNVPIPVPIHTDREHR